MKELWKDIPGYKGLYQISNFGRVKSFHEWKNASCPAEYILKNSISNSGYCQVSLYNGKKRKFLVHRLVADAFIPNPNNLPHINHKDEDPTNNRADNLEWCTPQYNNRYGTAKFRSMMTKGKPVKQFLIGGQWVATYANPTVASMITGISRNAINQCLCGNMQTASGFIWERG